MQLEIVMKPINEIIPYWRNPRRNDTTVDALVPVIQKNGFNVPIVIDKNGVVVKGHARLKAAKRLGMEKVPCIVSDASEDVIKADRIADNKIQELSSWDFAKLDAELNRLDYMEFKRLFRPEENPVGEDEDIPDVEFKPAGLQFWDGDHGGDVEPTEAQIQAVKDMVQDVRARPETAQPSVATPPIADDKVIPEKRKLKTLCPYCGKVVIIDV